jgi:hypothetical protein
MYDMNWYITPTYTHLDFDSVKQLENKTLHNPSENRNHKLSVAAIKIQTENQQIRFIIVKQIPQ